MSLVSWGTTRTRRHCESCHVKEIEAYRDQHGLVSSAAGEVLVSTVEGHLVCWPCLEQGKEAVEWAITLHAQEQREFQAIAERVAAVIATTGWRPAAYGVSVEPMPFEMEGLWCSPSGRRMHLSLCWPDSPPGGWSSTPTPPYQSPEAASDVFPQFSEE
jgi:hypothetical protein